MIQEKTNLARVIQTDLGVDASYRHTPKRVTPGEPIYTSGAVLKWYGLHSDDRPVPDEITRLARNYLESIELEARGMGLVILHRCGTDFYFLIVCTWRNENELWETVFYKDGPGMAEFVLFPRERSHKPVLCVWELVPVWHEQQAWVRFLSSARDEAAAQSWLDDRFAGPV